MLQYDRVPISPVVMHNPLTRAVRTLDEIRSMVDAVCGPHSMATSTGHVFPQH